ncbi:NAD-dependent glycerol-3-phosphate dehydrogenase [Dacryopinax primogenitus]|uniref:Glycerol-3-phosphate dehydrogenase [NAD(+)] n=1 Tax=Dacryopinax primogenitus (strain DJM 731) TaxID=1858805 RepID=M5FW98_DACPD|nr:NAD-dependent glycerol-3-phosphate dehydrogenase [Dacryopinax primogenitus]EJT99954.1 NAD-dependent glycerol-3-phosphate dehydrogenase [Dacryopinax primogenitus]
MELPEGLPPKQLLKVLVLGAGNFGSCLADHLADVDHKVYIWSREADVVEALNATHRNPRYLTEHSFPEDILALGPEFPDSQIINHVDVLLFAIPTEGLRETLGKVRDRLNHEEPPLFIFVNKGIEVESEALPLEIIADTCGVDIARVSTFVSGPSFAKEIVRRQPTTVSIASLSPEHAQRASDLFHQPWFRCYTNPDPVGVELAGALKNVYAIASGIADGMGYENNTRAGLITRSLAEMTRVGTAYGASPLTFLSLAGVGDLFLTCSSTTSRNFTVGRRLGEGEQLQHIIDTLGSVAEGVTTAKALHSILRRLEVTAPIAEGVYSVLYEGRGAHEMASELMSLPPQSEIDLPVHISKPVQALMAKLGIKEGDLSPRASVLSTIGPD